MMSTFAAFTMRDGYPRRIPDKGTYWHMGKEVKQRAKRMKGFEHPELAKPKPTPRPSRGAIAAGRDKAVKELDKIFHDAPRLGSYGEVEMALALGHVEFTTPVWYWFAGVDEEGANAEAGWQRTTGGRVLFNSIIPDELGFLNQTFGRARHQSHSYQRYGVVPDMTRAQEILGFEPQYRLELRRRGATRRLDTVRCR